MKNLLRVIAASLVIGISAAASEAGTIDLTTAGTSGVLDGVPGGNAWFIQGGTIVSGTGVFPAFVQVKAHGSNTTEHGYNTTVNNVMDNGPSDQHNHAIQMSELPVVYKDGLPYYEFLLDINESATSTNTFLSLDDLVIKTSTMPNQSATTIETLLGTTHWDMAAGDKVLLKYGLVSSGSGKPDMTFLVPVADFAGTLGTDYVYLYSKFGAVGKIAGQDYGASAGFEEWAMGSSAANVPDGGATLMFLGLALGGLGFARSRFNL